MQMEDRKMWIAGEGEQVFSKGKPMDFVGLILDGTVRVKTEAGFYKAGTGEVIGFAGIPEGVYSDTCVSETVIKLCPFKIKGDDPLEKLLQGDSKAVAIILRSLIGQACKMTSLYLKLYEETGSIYRTLAGNYRKYYELVEKISGKKPAQPELDGLEPLYEECEIAKDTLQYYSELGTITLEDIQKFAGERHAVAKYLADGILDYIKLLEANCTRLMELYRDYFEQFASEEKDCLLLKYFRLYKLGKETGAEEAGMVKLQIKYLIQTLEGIQERCYGDRETGFGYSAEKWYDTFRLYRNTEESDENETEPGLSDEALKELLEKELRDSMNRLLQYSDIPEERQKLLLESWQAYRGAKEKPVEEDQLRRILRRIEDVFYDVYESVFLRAEKENEQSLLIRFFLNFGFMDERIFSSGDLIELYHCMQKIEGENRGTYHIYSVRQWLQLIYSGKKEPSKNEFDMDYKETFLDMKKSRKFTPEEEKAYFADKKGKLHFEIRNMFQKNNRLISGQMGLFCPILTGEQILQGIEGNFLSCGEIEEGMEKIRKIDFSAFYRETMYQNPEKKIERAQIMVEVLPDFILMPCVGIRGSMWQDIEGKRRVSPGRFVLPMFLCSDISEILLKMVGKFRWELCRTIQGGYWNNISEKSLTSEFCDYLQFYKKNRDLNDQAKQKIRDKIKQFRNNYCDVFVNDYVQWVRYESKGASKLNKVSREIILRYCPFAAEYREPLMGNPMFSDMIGIWARKNELKAKAVQNQILHLEKAGAEITKEIKDTLDFYRM